ncbi:cytochrome P450 6j1-like [Chironomus tepperi]|uniref:cytochrome P450 6j1-like n=1 Tax=Chironomus tepperi TaxID=113505 RepID=UPI00391F276F
MEVHFVIVVLLVLLFICLVGWLVTNKNRNYFKLRGIAYIKPALFCGNFFNTLLELEHHEKSIHWIYEYFRTEKIFGIFNFLRPTIIVKDLNLAKQITIDYHDNFKNRDFYDIDHVLNKSLFNQRGENRMSMRNLMESYFSNETFKKCHHEQNVSNSELLVDHLWKDHEAVKSINIMFNFQLFLVNTYCDIIFGRKSQRNEDEVILLKIMKQVEKDMTSLSGKIKIILLTYFPRISKLFQIKIINSSAYESFRVYANKEMSCTCDGDKIGLIDYILKNKKLLSNEHDEIILQIFAFFIDGFFLTSKLFQACCYEPRIAQRCRHVDATSKKVRLAALRIDGKYRDGAVTATQNRAFDVAAP